MLIVTLLNNLLRKFNQFNRAKAVVQLLNCVVYGTLHGFDLRLNSLQIIEVFLRVIDFVLFDLSQEVDYYFGKRIIIFHCFCFV